MAFFSFENPETPLQLIDDEVTRNAGITLWLKRDDLIHPQISGNKWRKLKYNLLEAQQKGADTILTFGGAYSNHLYAVAAAGKHSGLKTIGIVRGDELSITSSATLTFCDQMGMRLIFVTREAYRSKEADDRIKSIIRESGSFVIPEGGSNQLALRGMFEMASEIDTQLGKSPDFFAVAAGTGGTAAGMLKCKTAPVIAFAVLKNGHFLQEDILSLAGPEVNKSSLLLQTDYHFGGYARHTQDLLQFIRNFEIKHGIPLDQVYTGKMMMGLYDLLFKGYFEKGTEIVAIHTGGLQGRLPSFS